MEIDMLKKINSIYVVKYIDHFTINEDYYLVLEYCNGGSLESQIRGKKLDE